MDMMISELLHLWDEYRLTNPPAHKLTFTDFMEYVKRQNEQDVKNVRLGHDYGFGLTDTPHSTPIPMQEIVNRIVQSKASVVKAPLRSALTKGDIEQVRKLYEQGYSLARIRQRLGLDVSLNRLQTVVNKPW